MLSPPGSMVSELITGSNGQIRPLLANVITVLRLFPEWRGVLRYDAFGMQTLMSAPPPWEAGCNDFEPRPWSPRDDVLVTNNLQRHGIAVSVDIVQTAIETVAQDDAFHPVQDYLDNLEWDRKPRLGTWLTDHLAVEASQYSRAVGERFLISAVARIKSPGCKADHMPVLEGAQGVGKSSAVKILGEPWFSDELADFGSKDAAMQLRSAWFLEISELDAMSRAEIARVKAFLTRTADRFRPPYGRRVIEAPRQCVFVGTTNAEGYLKDETGGRRFWPVKVGKIDRDSLSRARDQLWAETAHAYAAGSPWWLDTRDLAQTASEAQSERYVDDPWTRRVEEYIASLSSRDSIAIDLVLDRGICLPIERCGQAEQNRVARILKRLGFERYQVRTGDGRPWRYRQSGDGR